MKMRRVASTQTAAKVSRPRKKQGSWRRVTRFPRKTKYISGTVYQRRFGLFGFSFD
ncbi:hypothetical protein JSY36_10110 [Bacillus sp. H-16]|uniref:hypothetical protein n=1 Tax=Alteribacter salitolerans TaxID=2912333 RepID=UPI0019651248|nr:hypothetical protein [Alteribacter salitolerans]MBM7096110.1 hypothetical protein [Alteribacter salitolerans]